MKTLKDFKKDEICLKTFFGGKKIYRKEMGLMHYGNLAPYNGVYISVYDTETASYTYYSDMGVQLYC